MTFTSNEFQAVFVDTGAYLALVDKGDKYHQAALRFFEQLRPHATTLVTTIGVVGETYTWLRYKTDFTVAMRWLQALERSTTQGNTRIVYPGEDSDHEARQLLHRFSDQKLSYVDAVSLVVASREAIDAIFAFDHHLGLTGRVLVPGLID